MIHVNDRGVITGSLDQIDLMRRRMIQSIEFILKNL